mmetsp:Transcript_39958/g.133227  ORF Transcript_39958/g.133227 Transcript_39958/m.133227 type:complete len:215 (-) Transcript_39958:189-833(-)
MLHPDAAAFSTSPSASFRLCRAASSPPAAGSSFCARPSRAWNSFLSSRSSKLRLVPVPKAPCRLLSRSDRWSSRISRCTLSCTSFTSAEPGCSSRARLAALQASRQFSRPACACAARKCAFARTCAAGPLLSASERSSRAEIKCAFDASPLATGWSPGVGGGAPGGASSSPAAAAASLSLAAAELSRHGTRALLILRKSSEPSPRPRSPSSAAS